MAATTYSYLIGSAESPNFVLVIHGWITREEAARLFDYYKTTTPYDQPVYQAYGKDYTVPRLISFVGDLAVKFHTYSGRSHIVRPWDAESLALRERIRNESQVEFDAALINYYRSGQDYIAYHSDKEALGQYNSVIGVSLGPISGEGRDFYFRNKANPKQIVKTKVSPGDCMVMCGNIQREWEHSVPKRAHADERISLTFRNLKGFNG